MISDSTFALYAFFAKKNHPNWAELKSCPDQLNRGTLKALGTAWREYKSGKHDEMGRTRKAPRFKGQRFPIKTLSNEDCKGLVIVEGDTVKVPVLKEVRIKGNKNVAAGLLTSR